MCQSKSESCSVTSNSLQPHGLYSPWNSPGQNTGKGNLFLLQDIFPTQGSNSGLPHCRQILYQLSHKGNPRTLEWVCIKRLPYTLILLSTIHSSLWAKYAHICSICENMQKYRSQSQLNRVTINWPWLWWQTSMQSVFTSML